MGDSELVVVIWFVYIVECKDGTLYTGITTDVKARVAEHDAGIGAKYTKPRRPVKLLYTEEAENRSEACKREYQIKQLTRKQKQALVAELGYAPD